MSKLNNISESYGKEISFAVANCDSKTLLSTKGLPSNTLIIASPVDNAENDIGAHSLVMTDYEGTPTLLYAKMDSKNGMTIDANKNTIKLVIDDKTISVKNKALYINASNLSDNKTIQSRNNKLYVDTSQLTKADKNTIGTISIDGKTLQIVGSQLLVETDNLDKATNKLYGIVKGDNNTITITNGVASVNTPNLTPATETNYGIGIGDEFSIITENGKLSVDDTCIPAASNTEYGRTLPDNSTINIVNGKYSVKSIPAATNSSFGSIRPDCTSIIQKNGVIEVKNYADVLTEYENIKTEINNLRSFNLTSTTTTIKTPTVFTFMCNKNSSTVLTRPVYGLFENDLKAEDVIVETIVNTNCLFNLNIEFVNNISPEIIIKYILFDGVTYYGDEYKRVKLPSTNGKDAPLKIFLSCKNFASNENAETAITNIRMKINYTFNNDMSLTSIYSVVRYNSLYTDNLSSTPTILTGAYEHVLKNINVVGKESSSIVSTSKETFINENPKK